MGTASGHGNGVHRNGHANGSHRHGHAPAGRLLLDRLPPHNLEAERGVLGSVLLDDACLADVAAIVGAGDFYRDAHRLAFEAALAARARAGAVDGMILADELERRGLLGAVGGAEGIAEIMRSVPHAAHARYYAHIVRQKALVRAAIAAAEATLEDAYSNLHTADEVLGRARDRLAALDPGGDEPPFAEPHPWPEPPGPAAWAGLAGDVVRRIAPHTEADPVAVLVQLLVAVGNMAGRGPHWRVESTRHGLNLFACVVGNSSKARKGTSWDRVLDLVGECDPAWRAERVVDGLSSGEGLIWSVKSGDDESMLPADKRLLAVETEFGATLAVAGREGNTLSGLMRKAWDSGTFRSLTKNNPVRTRDAHVSVIGHITGEELERRLSQTDAANGFANRFLWVCARRSRFLPHGGALHRVDAADLRARLGESLHWAREEDLCLVRDDAANALWESVYGVLSEPRPGLLGAVTSRAEAQAMRIACVYALLDCSPFVRREHLEAGLALWRYCAQSAAYLFGSALGDPAAEKLLAAIGEAGEAGLSRRQIINDVFGKNRPAEEIDAILARLLRAGRVHHAMVPTGGRPAQRWYAGEAPLRTNEQNGQSPP